MSQVQGACEPQFQAVRQVFERSFREDDELGAAVAVYHRGRQVVNLWGGWRDPGKQVPWTEDTIACMMSVAKGVSAICLAMLHDRGQLDLGKPVAAYWPEFAEAGKAAVTVKQAMSHFAGIPVADAAPEGSYYDWDVMVRAIAAQAPLWPPGTNQIYHSATLGFMAGEILRRITGRSIGSFLREEISGPIGADYHIGLTASERARCATMVASARNVVSAAKRADPASIEYRMWRPLPAAEDFNSERWRSAEIPSVNGHGSARGVARIYGAMSNGGVLDGARLLRFESIEPFIAEAQEDGFDTSTQRLRMGLGFMLNSPPYRDFGPGKRTFGHSGAGGSQAFADPDNGIGFCYVPNRMHDGSDVPRRAGDLIKATFAAL